MKLIKFRDLTEDQLNHIINIHFNHWVNFNPKMQKENTIHKFNNIYTTDNLPLGLALVEEKNIIGFCVLKLENLKKYPEITPWIDDVMILKDYRGRGYGKKMIEMTQNILKEYGYKEAYLWTDQAPNFYKKLGFTYVQKVEKNEGGYGQLFIKKL